MLDENEYLNLNYCIDYGYKERLLEPEGIPR